MLNYYIILLCTDYGTDIITALSCFSNILLKNYSTTKSDQRIPVKHKSFNSHMNIDHISLGIFGIYNIEIHYMPYNCICLLLLFNSNDNNGL